MSVISIEMGLTFSFHGGESKGLDDSFDALLGAISFSGDYAKRNLCSKSFNGLEAKPILLKDFGSGKLIIEGSVSFKRNGTDPFQLETKISFKSSSPDAEDANMPNTAKCTRFSEEAVETPQAKPGSPNHEAAVKLQKVYKSFRTRRQLADCAVLVEQKWWKLLDFALLKRSSVSFFDIEKPESASSKWSRARTRAAKVGKGLSKDDKARKLALQHWLEAIDPRHRYGHNLHFYYDCWLRCESKQPFFYWLDVGEGKEVNLEPCPRSKLQHQCIKYLGPKEREAYEVIMEEGRFIYKKNGELLDTTGCPKDSKWIFVLSTSKNLYVGLKRKGVFQHSSFLAGGATSAAGRLVVENGVLKSVWPHSGHYRPTVENFEEFMSFLKENNVDLTDVKKDPDEDEEEWGSIQQSRRSESGSSISSVCDEPRIEPEPSNSFPELDNKTEVTEGSSINHERNKLEKFYSFDERTVAEGQVSEEKEEEKEADCNAEANHAYEKPQQSGDESTEGSALFKRRFMFRKPNLFIDQREECKEEELIIQRMGSNKGMKSCQLGQQLPFKWTTGAGPRIGFVRNYPSELQFSALEQVNLSPRGTGVPRPFPSPRKILETSTLKEI